MEAKLKSMHYFAEVPDQDLKDLESFFLEETLRSGRCLYESGMKALNLYFIISGEIELMNHLDPQGPERSLAYLKPGDCAGIGEIFFDAYYLNAYARTLLKVLRISKEDFMEKVLVHPAVNRAVLQDFASMTRLNTTFLYNRGARERLLLHLKTLIQDQENGTMVVLDQKVSITSLADNLNLTREHVSRVIKTLMKEKVLSKVRSRIQVDRQKLLAQVPF